MTSSAGSDPGDLVSVALITGITGQDGSYLAERLAAQGVQVHGLVRPGDRDATRFARMTGVRVHEGDLGDVQGLADLVRRVGPQEVYHLGGVSSVAQSWQEPVLTGLVSGLAVAALLEASWRLQEESGRPVRFVQASSAEMFGTAARSPQGPDTPIRPANPYGAAKAYGHHMAGVYRARGLHVASVILFPHESPRRPPTFVTRKITMAAARIAHDGAGEIVLGNLDARRDWGWAPDYVEAMVGAARADAGHDVVIATGVSHSVADFARTALARVGIVDWEPRVRSEASLVRPTDAVELVGDPESAHQLLGWRATTDFTTLVNRMVDHDLELLDSGVRGAASAS